MSNNGFGVKLVKVIVIALVFGLVAGGVFAGVNLAVNKFTGNNSSSAATAGVVQGTAVSTASTVNDVSDIANNALPSVVQVTNISLTQYRSMFGGTTIQETPSAGTGFIFAQDNDCLYIATNNHVVENANTLTVTFCNDVAVDARIVGTDVSDDLAVISVKLSDVNEETKNAIKVAVVGDSAKLTPGDGAVIIGNALGYGQSVTTGVISALNRKVSATDGSGKAITNTVIQTDAAVNPGNSGGPLLNMQGEVVGIVSAKLSNTAIEGVGYAIPSSTFSAIINDLMTNKSSQSSNSSDQSSSSASGAYLGIAGMDISQSAARQYGMAAGVYVTKVYSGSAAEKAGISQGDVITGFDGSSVSSMTQIKSALQSHKVGDKVTVTVAKGGNSNRTSQVEVTLTNIQ